MKVSALSVSSVAAILAALALFVAAVSFGSPASAQSSDITYNVKIDNLSDGQPLTPPLIVAHTSDTSVFTIGEAASDNVKEVAENGNLTPLSDALAADSAVIDTATADAPVLPGESVTLTIDAPSGSYLSWISMLICTNDGFVGIDSLALPASGSEAVDKNAYDAGTETNTEDFADMVPPCQSIVGVSSDDEGTGASDPALAEGGVISAHPGVQGGTDLTVADHGWTDPIARVTITVDPSSLPDTGGAPADGSSSTWLIVALVAGAALIAASTSTLALARRTSR